MPLNRKDFSGPPTPALPRRDLRLGQSLGSERRYGDDDGSTPDRLREVQLAPLTCFNQSRNCQWLWSEVACPASVLPKRGIDIVLVEKGASGQQALRRLMRASQAGKSRRCDGQ